MDLRGRISLQCHEDVISVQPQKVSRFLCLMRFLIWMSTWSFFYQLHQKTAVHCWFTYTCSVPWTSTLSTATARKAELQGTWRWCGRMVVLVPQSCLSRKLPVCVAQDFLAGSIWALEKIISVEKAQAGYLYHVRISPSSSDTVCFTSQVPVLKTAPKLTLRCCGESGMFNY